MSADCQKIWTLDRRIAFLNHGSFGACPTHVLRAQTEFRKAMESEPVRFLSRDMAPLLERSRRYLAKFVGTDSDGLVFVPNATHAVNSVFRSLSFRRGDQILITNHSYNACRMAVQFAAKRNGAQVVEAKVPFPVRSVREIIQAILAAVTSKTKIALIDHITSPTALVFPVKKIVAELQGRGIDVFVDGAHAPGMIPLDIAKINPAYYTGNCHKWLCAPKGVGFLWVREDRRERIHPLSISHAYTPARPGRASYQAEFDWTGTCDPTPYLCIPDAIEFMGSLVDGGWSALMKSNRAKALEAEDILCGALRVKPSASSHMRGSMASVVLPKSPILSNEKDIIPHPFQDLLLMRHRIEVPIIPWPETDSVLIRISAQLYNARDQYEDLARVLRRELNL